MDCLQHYNGAIVALAATAGVIITGVYAWFTWGLWRQARRQADITQQMVETSHRPYLKLDLAAGNFVRSADHYRVDFILTAHGNVPAVLTRWQVTIYQEDDGATFLSRQSRPDLKLPLYPKEEWPIRVESPTLGPAITGADRWATVRVDFSIEYRGAHATIHRNRLTVAGNFDAWNVVDVAPE